MNYKVPFQDTVLWSCLLSCLTTIVSGSKKSNIYEALQMKRHERPCQIRTFWHIQSYIIREKNDTIDPFNMSPAIKMYSNMSAFHRLIEEVTSVLTGGCEFTFASWPATFLYVVLPSLPQALEATETVPGPPVLSCINLVTAKWSTVKEWNSYHKFATISCCKRQHGRKSKTIKCFYFKL